MPKIFNRLITFKVSGEIYDKDTKPEDIIKNYEWKIKHNKNDISDEISICANHHDKRGRITNIVKLPNIQRAKKPDTEYFIV